MSDSTSPFGFGPFVPGFDFLQNLTRGASGSIAQLPDLAHWVAPTVSVEELDKRIAELKAVQFWLEQNARVLSATIQALEVQKMTLAALKGMNLRMGDLAQAFQPRPPAAAAPASAPAAADRPTGAVGPGADQDKPPARPAESAAPPASEQGAGAQAVVDPMQWWGALTSQFQQIAANALRDAASQSAGPASPDGAAPEQGAQGGPPPAPGTAKKPTAKAARKTAAAKSAAQPAPGKTRAPRQTAARTSAPGRG